MAGQIFVAQETAVLGHVGSDGPSHVALVEHIAAALGDFLIGVGQAGLRNTSPFSGRAAGREDIRESRGNGTAVGTLRCQ